MSTSLVVRQPGPLEVQPLDRPRAVDVRNAARLQHLRRAAEGTRTSWWNGSTVLDEVARQLGAEGFAVIDGFGGDEQAISLRATLERVLSQAHRGRMGSGGGGGATILRGDQVAWAEEVHERHPDLSRALSPVLWRLDALASALVRRLPDAAHLSWRGDVQLARYADGARYVRHVDNTCTSGRGARCNGRRLSAVYYTNPAWEEAHGGALRVLRMRDGAERPLADVLPRWDRVCVFWSDVRTPHEVLPAHAERYAATVWYLDEHEMRAAPPQHAVRVGGADAENPETGLPPPARMSASPEPLCSEQAVSGSAGSSRSIPG